MFRSARIGILTEVLQSSSVSAHCWTIEDEGIMIFRNFGNCLAQRHSVARDPKFPVIAVARQRL
jgi:hypothetical protein